MRLWLSTPSVRYKKRRNAEREIEHTPKLEKFLNTIEHLSTLPFYYAQRNNGILTYFHTLMNGLCFRFERNSPEISLFLRLNKNFFLNFSSKFTFSLSFLAMQLQFLPKLIDNF